MSIYDKLGNQTQQDMRQEVGKISAHPCSYLKAKGYTIPDNMTDAKQITQYLIQSGQVGNGRYQMVMRMLNGMRR